MNALDRLVSTEVRGSALDHVREVEKLYDALKKRCPAILNKIDYTIGFRCETARVLRVLLLLGFSDHSAHGTVHTLRNKDHQVRVMEPRDGWNPVLQVLN
jgi:hypothetical protein